MELETTQALLARLYTDRAFREAFMANPESATDDYELNQRELKQMAELAAGPALQFSRSLVRKRFGQIASSLPATRRVLRKQFWDAFVAFAGRYNPKGIGRHLDDALEFSKFLDGEHRRQIDAPAWWSMILNYERPGLKAQAAPFYFKLRFYRHDILRLYHASGDADSEYSGRPQLVIWCKWSPGGKVRHRHFFPRHWPG